MTIVELVKQVVLSWQVIAVTLVIVLYFFIVSYTARRYHRPKSSKKINLFKKKKSKDAAISPNETDSDSSSNDELGLEEA
jgi:anionic cell wall polymer biosynthesis LytR-Cps2A-Psr (LCP) family protein